MRRSINQSSQYIVLSLKCSVFCSTRDMPPTDPSMTRFVLHSQMWREAFQSVADEVERISQEVGKRVEQDPLASIGMPRPAKPRSSLDSRGIGGSTGTKRRRREEDAKERVEAKAAAMSDPFARRRTRPQSYWTVGSGGGSLTEVSWSVVVTAWPWHACA